MRTFMESRERNEGEQSELAFYYTVAAPLRN